MRVRARVRIKDEERVTVREDVVWFICLFFCCV